MPNYTFGNDTIINLPSSSGTATISGLSTSPYTFNPFAGVSSVTDGGTAGGITLRLIFSQLAGGVNGETLYTVAGGVTTATALGGTVTFVANNGAEAATWLNNVFVVDFSLNDRFRITLRGDDADSAPGINLNFNYRLACYVRGTTINTPLGAQPVEALRIGDMVTTLDGSAKPVKWIGHRTYEAGFGAAEAFVRPVLFMAGSLGDNLPVRELRVSPQHAMLVDGVMVPAAALVNGVSIVRDTVVADVEYFHIETAGHDVVFAEGAPAETFIDANSRAMFDNADEYGLLYGRSAGVVTSTLVRVEEGYQLAAIRRRLGRIAGTERSTRSPPGALQGNLERLEAGVLQGWVVDTANASEPVEADVLVDGEVVARVLANRYRADLDQAGLANGHCAFTVALPPTAVALDQVTLRRCTDGRELGSCTVDVAVV